MLISLLTPYLLMFLVPVTYSKGFICHQMLNNTLFKFSPLMKPYDYSYQFVDGGIKKELEFNFCKKISKKCQGQQTYAGVFWQTPEQKCFSFSHPKFSSVMQEYYNI
jgi:hypothetical protein